MAQAPGVRKMRPSSEHARQCRLAKHGVGKSVGRAHVEVVDIDAPEPRDAVRASPLSRGPGSPTRYPLAKLLSAPSEPSAAGATVSTIVGTCLRSRASSSRPGRSNFSMRSEAVSRRSSPVAAIEAEGEGEGGLHLEFGSVWASVLGRESADSCSKANCRGAAGWGALGGSAEDGGERDGDLAAAASVWGCVGGARRRGPALPEAPKLTTPARTFGPRRRAGAPMARGRLRDVLAAAVAGGGGGDADGRRGAPAGAAAGPLAFVIRRTGGHGSLSSLQRSRTQIVSSPPGWSEYRAR